MGESFSLDDFGPALAFLAGRPVPQKIHEAAGANVPHIAGAIVGDIMTPVECDWSAGLDLTGDDGRPDELGNDRYGCCVEVATLRLAQAQSPYPRKPTFDGDVAPLFRRWTGREPDTMGTQTGPAFDDLAAHGIPWADQDVWLPRRVVVKRDGEEVDTRHLRLAISAFRGVAATVWLPRDGFDFTAGFVMPPGQVEMAGQHEVAFLGYTSDAVLKVYTWGGVFDMPLAWFLRFGIEVNGFPSQWLTPERLAVQGVSWDQLCQISADVAS